MKQKEEPLIDLGKKYRDIINNILDVIVEIDAKGKFIYLSPQVFDMFGFRPEELTGLSVYKFIHPEDFSHFKVAMEKLIKFGGSLIEEFRVKHKNGYYIQTSVKGSLVKGNGTIKMLGILRDFTKTKEAEKKLKESEKKYRGILENIKEGYFEVDLKGNYTFVNDFLCKILGYSREELLKKNYRLFYEEERNREIFKLYNQLYKNEIPSPLIYETPLLTQKGERPYIEALVDLKYDPEGKKVGFFGLIRDIRERKEAEQKLKESEKKYKGILENMIEGYYETDLRGNYIFVNEYYSKMIGYPREEFKGKNYHFFFDEQTSKKFVKMFSQVYETGIPLHTTTEVNLLTKKKKLIYHEGTISLVYDSEGNKIGFFGLVRDITKSKKTEYKLKESEKKYRGILENMTEGYFENDLKGSYTFVSNSFCKIFGYTREELLGKNYRLILDENTSKEIFKLYNQLYKTRVPIPPDNFAKVITSKGKQLFLEGSGDLLYDSEGKKVGIFGLIRDITNRKEAEQKLKEFETKYKGILENIKEGYYEMDLRGNYTFVSDFYCKVLGFSKEELLGKNANLIFDEKSIKNYNKLFAQIYKTGISFPPSNIIEVSTTKGKKISFEGSADLIYDSEGNKVGFFGLARDVSERVHAEQKLKQSEHKLEGRVRELNCLYEISKTIEKRDVSFEEIIQETLELIPPACQFPKITCAKITYDKITYATKNFKETKWKVATHLSINEKLMNIEVYHLEEKPFVMEEKNLINDIGQRLKIIFERKKVEEELRELSNLKSEFLRRASHELKTPLISIKGFSNLILSLYLTELNPDVIIKMNEINQGCERLQNIINDLLHASRLDATNLKPKTKKEDLSFLIKFCVNELRSLAETRNQSINLEIHSKIFTNFEKEEIYDVLSNLLTNAIKYTLPNGRINVKTEILEDYIIVSVKDSGIGFTNDEKLRIFKQFGKIERYGQGHDLGIDGTGLGLYISKRIVESHNGRMWMESEGKNKGSTFYFSLPKLRES